MTKKEVDLNARDFLAELREIAAQKMAEPHAPCPGCGSCPTCGRRNSPVWGWPYYSQPYFVPTTWGPITCGTMTNGATTTVTYGTSQNT